MYSNPFEIQAIELERRKDEIRAAARYQLAHRLTAAEHRRESFVGVVMSALTSLCLCIFGL